MLDLINPCFSEVGDKLHHAVLAAAIKENHPTEAATQPRKSYK